MAEYLKSVADKVCCRLNDGTLYYNFFKLLIFFRKRHFKKHGILELQFLSPGSAIQFCLYGDN